MALKSWSIDEFTGATSENLVTEELLDSGASTIILLSLILCNNSDSDEANITVSRLDSLDAVKSHWEMAIPPGNSPVAIDSMMVFTGGDKLAVTSAVEDVSVDASGDEVS